MMKNGKRNMPAFQPGTFATNFIPKGNCLKATSPLRVHNATRPNKIVRPQMPTMRVYDVEVNLNGETYNIPINEELTLLEGIEEFGLEVLYSCRAGVCVTCAAKVMSGEIDPGFASITQDLKDDGYVLTCSAYPRSEGIKLDMGHFDDAYERQYGQYEKEKEKEKEAV